MPLDSDITNADAQLHVEFYEYKGEGPDKGKHFVRIVVPGDKTNVIDQPAREDHKVRFSRQWLHYQMKNTDAGVVGVPLLQWHSDRPEELTDGQLSELHVLKFLTVEQVATASDAQVMRIGMGGAGIRERARSYLSAKNAQTSGAALEKQAAELAELRQMVAQMQAGTLAGRIAAQKTQRKPGWPKGKPRTNKGSVNVHNDTATAGAAGG